MDLDKRKKMLNEELDHFNSLLEEFLVHYNSVKHSTDYEPDTLEAMEEYVIELNGKIAEIQRCLDMCLFGEMLNVYNEERKQLNSQGESSKELEVLRMSFLDSLKESNFFNWN